MSPADTLQPCPAVTIGIVTWNSAEHLRACLAAVRRLAWPQLTLRVLDNGSTDETPRILAELTAADERVLLTENTGFAGGHNRLIRLTNDPFYLALNPDVELAPDFLSALVPALAGNATAGSATGKLLRAAAPATLDSTGIVMLPSQRHLDRGAGEVDRGQFDARQLVFGASGAAALYKRTMLEAVAVGQEYFDEDFFAYREDADLAWRAQLLGWDCLYVPEARACHHRRVTPERRASLPASFNRYSVRNRFLLRLKNQTPHELWRFLAPAVLRDAQVVGYVLVSEWSSIPGLVDVLRLLPRTLAKRRAIMKRRRRTGAEMAAWFQG